MKHAPFPSPMEKLMQQGGSETGLTICVQPWAPRPLVQLKATQLIVCGALLVAGLAIPAGAAVLRNRG